MLYIIKTQQMFQQLKHYILPRVIFEIFNENVLFNANKHTLFLYIVLTLIVLEEFRGCTR